MFNLEPVMPFTNNAVFKQQMYVLYEAFFKNLGLQFTPIEGKFRVKYVIKMRFSASRHINLIKCLHS